MYSEEQNGYCFLSLLWTFWPWQEVWLDSGVLKSQGGINTQIQCDDGQTGRCREAMEGRQWVFLI